LSEFRPLVKKLLQISKLVRGWNVGAQ